MSNYAMQQKERQYFDTITNYIQSLYEQAKDTDQQVSCANIDESIDFKKSAENLLGSLNLELDEDNLDKFANDFEKGFKQLHKEMQLVIDEYKNSNKELSGEELVRNTGLKGRVEKLDKDLDYIDNPTFLKKIKTALQKFATFISESFSMHSGKDQHESITMLTKAFKGIDESVVFKIDDEISRTGGHVGAIEKGDSIRENNKNMTFADIISAIKSTVQQFRVR